MKESITAAIISLLFLNTIYSQNIKWTNVNYRDIDPIQLSSKGFLKIKGKATDNSDLAINFNSEKVFYKSSNNKIFSLNEDEFNEISIVKYKSGLWIDSSFLFSDAGKEVAATLRKELYKTADLNVIEITSVEKEGFFKRKKPKFYIDNGELDVSNKTTVKCKILSINEDYISYIDSDGDILNRSNISLSRDNDINQDKENDKEEKEKLKKIKRTARILNIKFDGKLFVNSYELYNYLFDAYEKKFYKEIEKFKNNFIGKNISDILETWGPSSSIDEMNGSKKLYTWVFEKKSTTGEEFSVSNEYKTSKSVYGSSSSTSGEINTNSSSRSSNRSSYNSVLNSYDSESSSSGKSTSFLQFHSSSSGYSVKSVFGKTITTTNYNSTEIDVSEKIALIVDNNLKIINVLNKDFIEYPQYGTSINFVIN
tara:strand:+ start:20 stop:1294 length:1275 start_codon:yes stop_codon:yes gene_type:complete